MNATAPAVDFSQDVLPILSDNCFHCHGPDAANRQTDLRLDDEASAKQQRGGVVVIAPGDPTSSELYRRISSDDPYEIMPPSDSQRKLTKSQVEVIRQWIQEGAEWTGHWAYQPLARPAVPDVGELAKRVENPIDNFVFAGLAAEGLEPAVEANRATLIRRVTLDLTGLPPTPEEVSAFQQDATPEAYVHLVDRLLASPAFGERMAWEWLDAARYADTNGYQGDNERTMWPWRDWVVQALNDNMPYDQFTVWQLAGDLLPDATPKQQLATAFCRNHMINGEGGRIAEENRVDYVMDMTETMGTVWLGLTLNCCRCHDHKFDPLTRREYYQLFAFFNQTPVNGGGGNAQTPPVIEWTSTGTSSEQAAKVMVMQDMAQPRETFMLEKGLYDKPGERVTASVPASLPPLAEDAPRNRLGLARWLVSDEHPLTARVLVNRFWQQFFGLGLVKSAEDFGVQGDRPVQRELLDWLAAEFRDSGWDVKSLCRLIVTSATYRQSSRTTPEWTERDPENRLLARGPRYRMPSWMIRDQALAASGLLVRKIGGPPVRPYQPDGVWAEATFGKKRYQADTGEGLYRRSLYTFWRRIVGPTMFFDSASRQTCSVKPSRTNTPLHSLATLNDVTYVEAARALAERIWAEAGDSASARIDMAFRLVLVRPPTVAELDVLTATLERLRQQYTQDLESAKRLLAVGASSRDESFDPVEHAAYTSLCLAILNLDEALTKE